MMAASHAAAPVPVLLPPASNASLTDAQWEVLFSVLDALLPPIVPEGSVADKRRQLRISRRQYEDAFAAARLAMPANPPDLDRFKEYLRTRQSDSPRFVSNVKRTFNAVSSAGRKELAGILNLLNTRVGSFFLSGYCTPFPELPLHVRHAVVQSWYRSWTPMLRILARTMSTMAQKSFSQTDPLFQRLIGYTDHPADYKPAPGFDFKFLQFGAGEEPAVIDTDVVIVGSGCCGGVCAKTLAEAGHRVLVVDKGYYFPPSQLPMDQEAGSELLFEGQGIISSDDNSLNILAGSCWGGGGTVNWSVCLEPQDFVRKEWADEGLPLFLADEFQESIDRVCDLMGASDAHIRHNHGGQVILDGSRRLGWKAKACPQNTATEDHYCGRCNLGCPTAGKKGPAVSSLPAASRAGAQCIEGFTVSELTLDESTGSKKAVGLVGTWVSRDRDGGLAAETGRVRRRVQVRAKKVIVAAGALQSPLVLLRSGLTNPHIGRNLHLHPTNNVVGRFEEDVQPWEGSSITSVCAEFENLDGKGHGVKLETISMVFPWYSGLEFKLNALKFRNMNAYISLARDRDPGRVYPDPVSGEPRVDYTPSAFDRANILAGVVGLAKICYVEGAQEIFTFLPGARPFMRRRHDDNDDDDTKASPPRASSSSSSSSSVSSSTNDPEVTDPDFAAWLASLARVGNAPRTTPFGSAHQMGTCRMSAAPDAGVVDARGRVWGVDGLYVADSSVFPSASGVNPMVTAMAIADHIALGVVAELAAGEA